MQLFLMRSISNNRRRRIPKIRRFLIFYNKMKLGIKKMLQKEGEKERRGGCNTCLLGKPYLANNDPIVAFESSDSG